MAKRAKPKHAKKSKWPFLILTIAITILFASSCVLSALFCMGGLTGVTGITGLSGFAVWHALSQNEAESTTSTGGNTDLFGNEITDDATAPTEAPKEELNVTSHAKTEVTTTEPRTTFAGTSSPKHPLTINGKEIKRDGTGAFSVEYDLKVGDNTFTFSHKGEEVTYTVKYNYVVMRSYTPSAKCLYQSGATFSVVVSAREGSTVTASFRGKTITLKQVVGQGRDESVDNSDVFVNYSGSFSLPKNNTSDQSMGSITFKATKNGQTDTGKSGAIICQKPGKKVIGEIVAYSAETFDGDTSDDDSRPTNSYLPQGTMDYVVGHAYYGEKEYLILQCGRRVYVDKEITPPTQTVTVSKEYTGTLPSTNKLSVDKLRVTDDATYLTLETDWKAPFFVELLPQKYKNPSSQDYRVTNVTCEYVEITFCYASALSGSIKIPKDHPLFTKATIQKSGKNTVLRLYLRRTGGFYGWDAYYNSAGQLEFYFLHPAQVTEDTSNRYGVNLKGTTILLDVGHGAKSAGASGLDSSHPEGERNYYLATLIKKELESTGATVVLNRSSTQDMDQDKRSQYLKKVKPDLCIAIHHDSSSSSKPNGFGSFYSTPYSSKAAQYVYDATMKAGVYDENAAGNNNRLGWHYYFVARLSDCPVVLTENGYMSSPLDHEGIISSAVNQKKAQAISLGVAKYFLSIRISGYSSNKTTAAKPVTTTTVTTTKKATTTKKTNPTSAPALVEPSENGTYAATSLGLVGKKLHTYGDVDAKLADDLEKILKSYSKKISIACWSVDGTKALLYNTQQTFFSACTIKMPVMYGYCLQMDAGNINPNTKLTYQSRHYYGGSGEIRYKPYGSTFTTKYLVEKSISVSDNVAYVMLLEKYGKSMHADNMKRLGCDSVNFSSGSKWAKTMNARDLMVVWSEVYRYFCSDSPNAKMLKDACTNTKFNYGTKRVTEYDYSHKSGDSYGQFPAYNDAGIIWADVPYIYVVLTNSEGTKYDQNTVDPAMEIVKKIMTK